MDDEVEVGDHVYLGGGTVHWVVKEIRPSTRFKGYTVYILKSGKTGVHRSVVVGQGTVQLRIHTKGSKS